MRVEVGAAQTGKVLETANDAAIGQTFEIGTSHVGDKRGVGAKGAIGQARIIGIGQDIDNGHEVDIETQTRSGLSRRCDRRYRPPWGCLSRQCCSEARSPVIWRSSLTSPPSKSVEIKSGIVRGLLHGLIERDQLAARLRIAVLILDQYATDMVALDHLVQIGIAAWNHRTRQ